MCFLKLILIVSFKKHINALKEVVKIGESCGSYGGIRIYVSDKSELDNIKNLSGRSILDIVSLALKNLKLDAELNTLSVAEYLLKLQNMEEFNMEQSVRGLNATIKSCNGITLDMCNELYLSKHKIAIIVENGKVVGFVYDV